MNNFENSDIALAIQTAFSKADEPLQLKALVTHIQKTSADIFGEAINQIDALSALFVLAQNGYLEQSSDARQNKTWSINKAGQNNLKKMSKKYG